ncbi:hypothetical protein D3C72_2287970 [compost metagenome]
MPKQLAVGGQTAFDGVRQHFNAEMPAFEWFAVEIKGHFMGRIDFQPRQGSTDHVFVFFIVKQAGDQCR